ncbi:Nuclear transport factor 2 [Geodia barretti]|uniref:Nuclear transport factor 2 n=1 Tax=Geodia barretti TaxID=519541 RepID=A0AA35SDZ9_GEOBA|nr:Nuclear transport factor 2 [Geodia barretti]
MSSPEVIGKQFVAAFYQTFDTNRAGLAPLYGQGAMLSYEGELFSGQEAIVQKLTSLPFQTIVHQVTTHDFHLTVDGGLLVTVVGQLKADSDPIHGFTEVFYLKQVGDGLFVFNDIFRLALHHQ